MPTATAASIRDLFPELPDADAVVALVDGVGLGWDTDPTMTTGLERLASEPDQTFDAPDVAGADLGTFAAEATAGARERLRAVFASHAATREHADRLAQVRHARVVERVEAASLRTLVAVLHTLREAGQLRGATSEERFDSFCALGAHAPFRATVRAAFPALAAQIDSAVEDAVVTTRLLVERLDDALRTRALEVLAPGSDVVTAVDGPTGDLHAGGNGVMILTFGSGRRIVYKPRSLTAEAGLAALVERFGENAGTRIEALSIVDRGDHGWQEFADGSDPDPDAATYYRACGELLGVLHLLRASDMHFENVVNHRGLPVAIDAETLFSANERKGGTTPTPLLAALAESVIPTGMLPSRVDLDASGQVSVELGFLGANPGQAAVPETDLLVGLGTDQVRIRRVDEPVEALDDIDEPWLSEVELSALTEGFAHVYAWTVDHRSTVRTWLTELFGAVAVRSVLQNTWAYVRLLGLATHPRFQESPALRRVLLHRTAIGRTDHFSAAAIRAEITDLDHGDVPYFTVRTDDTGLYHWDGTRLADVLERAPIDRALAALDRMSPTLLRHNVRAIEHSFVSRIDPALDRPTWTGTADTARPGAAAHGDAKRDVVASIAGDLADRAARGTDGTPTGWIGATVTDTSQPNPWRVTTLGDGLYAGATGLSWFLTAAGVALDDESWVDLAESHLLVRAGELLADVDARRAAATGGFAGGYAGIAYALLNGGRLTGRRAWTRAGIDLWTALGDDVTSVRNTDLLLGTTGIAALSGAIADAPWLPATDRASIVRTRDAALADAVRAVPALAAAPLVYSGYAHGLAGLTATFGGLASASADAAHAHAQALTAAAAYFPDDPWGFSSDRPDQRANGWCHGAPGLLLSQVLRHEQDDAAAGAAIPELIGIVRETGFGLNYSLCHGDVGNLVILRRAALHIGDEATLDLVDRHTRHLAGTLPERLAAGIGKSVQNDALMIGRAGIGLGLLLLDDDQRIPSPLELGIAR